MRGFRSQSWSGDVLCHYTRHHLTAPNNFTMQALEKLLALPIRATGTLARAPPLILQPNGGLMGR